MRRPGPNALHEAAHAVVAFVVGIEVEEITIKRHSSYGGMVTLGDSDGNNKDALLRLFVVMAGPTADAKVRRYRFRATDVDTAWEVAGQLAGGDSKQTAALMRSAYTGASVFVGFEWESIVRIAEALEERRTMTGDEARALWVDQVELYGDLKEMQRDVIQEVMRIYDHGDPKHEKGKQPRRNRRWPK